MKIMLSLIQNCFEWDKRWSFRIFKFQFKMWVSLSKLCVKWIIMSVFSVCSVLHSEWNHRQRHVPVPRRSWSSIHTQPVIAQPAVIPCSFNPADPTAPTQTLDPGDKRAGRDEKDCGQWQSTVGDSVEASWTCSTSSLTGRPSHPSPLISFQTISLS